MEESPLCTRTTADFPAGKYIQPLLRHCYVLKKILPSKALSKISNLCCYSSRRNKGRGATVTSFHLLTTPIIINSLISIFLKTMNSESLHTRCSPSFPIAVHQRARVNFLQKTIHLHNTCKTPDIAELLLHRRAPKGEGQLSTEDYTSSQHVQTTSEVS